MTTRNKGRNGDRNLPTHTPSGEKIVTYKGQRYTETGLELVKQTEAEEHAKRDLPPPVTQVQDFNDEHSDNTMETAATNEANRLKQEAEAKAKEEAQAVAQLKTELEAAITAGDRARAKELQDRLTRYEATAIDLPGVFAAIDERLKTDLERARTQPTDQRTVHMTDKDLANAIKDTAGGLPLPGHLAGLDYVQLSGLESRGQLEALYAMLTAMRQQWSSGQDNTAAIEEGQRRLKAENEAAVSRAAADLARYEEWQQSPIGQRITAARDRYGLGPEALFFFDEATGTLAFQRDPHGGARVVVRDVGGPTDAAGVTNLDLSRPPAAPRPQTPDFVPEWDDAEIYGFERPRPQTPDFVPGWDDALELGEEPDAWFMPPPAPDAGIIDELELGGLGGDPLLADYHATLGYQRALQQLEAFEARLTPLGGNIYRRDDGVLFRRDPTGYYPVVQNLDDHPEAPAFLDVGSALATAQAEQLRVVALAQALQEARGWGAAAGATLAGPAASGLHATDALRQASQASQASQAELDRMAAMYQAFAGRDGSPVLTRQEADELTNRVAAWVEGDANRLIQGAERVRQTPRERRLHGVQQAQWRLADGTIVSAAEYRRLVDAAEERTAQADYLRAVRDGRWETANAAVLTRQGGGAMWRLPDGTLMSRHEFARLYGPFRRDTTRTSALDYLGRAYGPVASGLYSGIQTTAALARGDTSRSVFDLETQRQQYAADRSKYYNRLATGPWYDWPGFLPGAGSFAATYGDGRIRGWEYLGVGLDALDVVPVGGAVVGRGIKAGVRAPFRLFAEGVRPGSPPARIGAAGSHAGRVLGQQAAHFGEIVSDPARYIHGKRAVEAAYRRWFADEAAYRRAVQTGRAARQGTPWRRLQPPRSGGVPPSPLDAPKYGLAETLQRAERRANEMYDARVLGARSAAPEPNIPGVQLYQPPPGATPLQHLQRQALEPLPIQALEDLRLPGELRLEHFLGDAGRRPWYALDADLPADLAFLRTTRQQLPRRIIVEDEPFRSGGLQTPTLPETLSPTVREAYRAAGLRPPGAATARSPRRMVSAEQFPGLHEWAEREARRLSPDYFPRSAPLPFPTPATQPAIGPAVVPTVFPSPATQPAIGPARTAPGESPGTRPPPATMPSRFPHLVPFVSPGGLPQGWPQEWPGIQPFITTWTLPDWTWQPTPWLQPAPAPQAPDPYTQLDLQPLQQQAPGPAQQTIQDVGRVPDPTPDPQPLGPARPVPRWEMDPFAPTPAPPPPADTPRPPEETARRRPPRPAVPGPPSRRRGRHPEWVRAVVYWIEHRVHLGTGEHQRTPVFVEHAPFEVVSWSDEQPQPRTVPTTSGALTFSPTGVEFEAAAPPRSRPRSTRPRGPRPRNPRRR